MFNNNLFYWKSKFKNILSPTISNVNNIFSTVLYTAGAMIAGLTTLSLASNFIEQVTSTIEPMPLYQPNANRFNDSSYKNRFYQFLLYCDPSLLLYGNNEHIRCRGLLENYLQLTSPPLPTKWSLREMSRNLWEAHRITYQEVNPPICSLSAYVTFTAPICIAMMCSKSTIHLILSSLLHQTQNALITDYYYSSNLWNLNTKSPGREMDSYLVSIIATLGMIFTLKNILPEKKLPNIYLPFPISLMATTLSVYVLVSPQSSGLPLINEDSNKEQTNIFSETGSKYNVNMTLLSRALLQIPLFFFPPFVVQRLLSVLPQTKRSTLMIPLITYITIISYGLGFPAIMALNPNKIMVNSTKQQNNGEQGCSTNFSAVNGLLLNSCPMGMHIITSESQAGYTITSTTKNCPVI